MYFSFIEFPACNTYLKIFVSFTGILNIGKGLNLLIYTYIIVVHYTVWYTPIISKANNQLTLPQTTEETEP